MAFFANIDLGVLFIFAISGLAVHGIILSGWPSNSKYAFFGAIRSSAQMISYEISLGLILITLLFCVGSLNFVDIVYFQCFVFFLYSVFCVIFNVFNINFSW